MEKLWVYVIEMVIALMAVMLLINASNSSMVGVQTVSAKVDGLEKVQQTTLIDSSMTQGITVKGGDVIGAIRYYLGTSGISIVVEGWGASRSYGTIAGELNREWLVGDFPLPSELEFYKSMFKVSRTDTRVVYTKI